MRQLSIEASVLTYPIKPNSDFVQKKLYFFENTKGDAFFFTILNGHSIEANEKIERVNVLFNHIFIIFRVPDPHFYEMIYFLKLLHHQGD